MKAKTINEKKAGGIKMKKIKQLAAAGLAICMALASVGCGGGNTTANNGSSNTGTSGAAAAETAVTNVEQTETTTMVTTESGIKIGYNYFGTGGYSLAALANQTQIVLDACGDESISADNQFSVETLVNDVENMVSAGCDGVVIWLPAEALYPTVAQICSDAGVYFVLNDKVPFNEDIRAQIISNEYFAGACAPANDVYGKILADYAINQGWKTCIITSSAEGDASDQPRLDAFKAEFAAVGGTILSELHADTTADSLPQIQDALIANDEPDFIYGVGSDYAINACTALEDYPDYQTKVITSGLDREALGLLMDENSPLEVINGDYWISGLFSAVMLQNACEGNVLKDADGNVIFVDNVQPFEVSSATYSLYEQHFMNEPVYTADEIRAMIGITYDEMIDIIHNYNLDNRLMDKYKMGLITAEDMKAAGYSVE